MRDLETIAVAIETAETGHLVLGTLHTTTAASTVDRIIDQFPADRQSQIRVMLSESLKGVIAQTLCKKDGRRTCGGAGDPARHARHREPDSRGEDVPDSLDHPDVEAARHADLNDALLDLVEKKEISPDEAYVKSVEKSGWRRHSRPRGTS